MGAGAMVRHVLVSGLNAAPSGGRDSSGENGLFHTISSVPVQVPPGPSGAPIGPGGSRIVESDWRLFCTLIRFDAVYHGHFKCNLRRIVDYPNLDGYLLDLYQQPRIAETVNMDHIKRHYYVTHDDINPTRIVPIGPELDFGRPHGREGVGPG